MLTLDLDPIFLDSVLSGSKTSTIRRGRRSVVLGPATLRCGNRALSINIREAQVIAAGSLSNDQAMSDGFSSVESLWGALRRYYPELSPGDEVTVIRYELEQR
jgi:hypothetical protein